MNVPDPRSRFWRIASAGIFFQGGAAAIDTGTIVASLVDGLTGSAAAVGAAAAISRYGWLFPQIFVAYLAQTRRRRLPFYMLGAFGRVSCLLGVAVVVAAAGGQTETLTTALFFVLWTLFSFISGVVAVPYNDIVARSVPSAQRSRLLAVRFFGGGLLALGVAAMAHRVLGAMPFPQGHAAVIGLGATSLLVSAIAFVSAGEPEAPRAPRPASFSRFIAEGLATFARDRRLRLFVLSRWSGGAAAMAQPFYVLSAMTFGIDAAGVAVLLGAQTAGALAANPVWGWWGDALGKRALLQGVAALSVVTPAAALGAPILEASGAVAPVVWFGFVFFTLGALGNGMTIAELGYLMEISPDDQRPAYSGYFNALVAPAALSPLVGAAVVSAAGLDAVFSLAVLGAMAQVWLVRRLRHLEGRMGAA